MKVRVIESVAVQHPELPGQLVTLRVNEAFPHDDPLVKAYPWAFESDVESATAAPGEKRSVSR